MTDSIALVGRTNVGKSLLFNKLVQYKNSIVLNKHGVTRDVNQGKLLYEDKYLHLYDTAGITSQDVIKIRKKPTNSFCKNFIFIFHGYLYLLY